MSQNVQNMKQKYERQKKLNTQTKQIDKLS